MFLHRDDSSGFQVTLALHDYHLQKSNELACTQAFDAYTNN